MMFNSTIGVPWQLHSRKKPVANGTIGVLILFLSVYYLSWNILQTFHATSHSTIEAETQIPISLPAAVPSCPPLLPPTECPPPPPPPSPYDPTKLAFMVETRPLPHLPALFAHMTSLIPPEWTFKFMGSNSSISFLRSNPMISRLESSGKVAFLPLPSNYSLSSRETISQMFTDPSLYRHILAPAEHLLVFQPDAIFCANAPTTLNDFLEWDWVGAPWSKTATWGGNGGLSLRKVSKILQVLDNQKRPIGDGALEDMWLARGVNSLAGAKMPNANISKTFSVESVWDESPLGYHIGWLGVHHEQIWDDEAQVQHVLEYCPEVKMILGMRLDGDKPESVQRQR